MQNFPDALFALPWLNLAALLLAAAAFLAYKNKQYKQGSYFLVTKNSYSAVRYDKGRYAEYLTYKSLRHFEDNGGKFLFNVLIPKGHGKTTEIDVLLICSKGLFVFECKNYSGWIFGNEAHQYWTQTFPKGPGQSHKERFYNPIMQNASHIRHLRNLIGQSVPMRSVIVFSNRCTLKNITIQSDDISVINHYRITSVVAQTCSQQQADIFTDAEINDIYSALYPYTQCSWEVKERHIENITRNREL